MKKMRQAAVGGLPRLRPKTPEVCEETPTKGNLAPVAFSLNQSSALCLPMVSDSKKFIWVHSNLINLQMDVAAELDKTFNKFPYLTQNQMAALAQRCRLHPDQVKVWFMEQRLRYGISWDFEDIIDVCKSSQEKEGLQNDRGKNNQWKRDGKESGGKKAGEAREENSANEGRMTGENVRANERLERKMKQPMKEETDRKEEALEDERRSTQKKWKRMTVSDKLGKKRRVDEIVVERAGDVEITSDEVKEFTKSKPTQLKTTRKKKEAEANKGLLSAQEWPAHKSFVVCDEVVDVHPPLTPLSQTEAFDGPPLIDNQNPNIHITEMEPKLEGELRAESTNPNGAITDVSKLKKRMEVIRAYDCTQRHRNKKTCSQLAIMREAFLNCQYPDRESYSGLAVLIGIPRYRLIQWFNDMRYRIKKTKPRWMNQEQYSRVLAIIKFQQCMEAPEKAYPRDGSGKATQKRKLDRSESCGSVQVPPEKK